MRFFVFIFSLFASTAFATSDGPDTYRVRNVKAGDVLNLRENHSAKAKIISKIPPQTNGIKNLGENWPQYNSDAPPTKETLAGRSDLTQQEKKALLQGQSWCKVEYQEKQGWVLCKYLGE